MQIKHHIFTFLFAGILPWLPAADWPAYMHDPARTGITAETLNLPLAEHWVMTPPAPPVPAWPPAKEVELSKMDFDRATQVAVVGDTLFYGSAVDNGIHALDLANGAKRWSFNTDGPVRLAPSVADGLVYAGSDDGQVYCLKAGDGSLAWSVMPLKQTGRMLGAGRLMSQTPVRTNILVENGVAYCGAGIFPSMETTVVALDAKTGKQLWQPNAPTGVRLQRAIPQGYLTLSPEHLFVPRARSPVTIYAKADGKFIAAGTGRTEMGGDYGLFAEGVFYCGQEGAVYGLGAGHKQVSMLGNTKQLLVTPELYICLTQPFERMQRQYWQSRPQNRIVALARPAFKPPAKAGDFPPAAIRWQLSRPELQCMIAAGPHLFAGGAGAVLAVDLETGKEVWQGIVEGTVHGLAAANGRLLASTDNGRIYCFGSGPAPAAPKPVAAGQVPTHLRELAAAIGKDAGSRRGFGLVLGADSPDLARALALDTELLIYAAVPDAATAAAARAALAASGDLGSRVVVEVADPQGPARLPYPPYFANLVVADAKAVELYQKQLPDLLRTVKPCGGRLYAATADGGPPPELAPAWEAAGTLHPRLKLGASANWLRLERGRLPGSGEWTHQFGDAGNTLCSGDTLLDRRPQVLWYGEPGPLLMHERHDNSQSPIVVDGKAFVQGIRGLKLFKGKTLIMCFDIYNGLPYWERELPGAQRLHIKGNCGNMAGSAAGLFVAVGRQCLQLHPDTGETVRTFQLPAWAADTEGTKYSWEWLAVAGDLLLGSASPTHQFSSGIFAYDIPSGKVLWEHRAPVIRNATIAVSAGRVFFAEHRGRDQAPKVYTFEEQLAAKRKNRPLPKQNTGPENNLRTVTALELATGRELWHSEIDIKDLGSWVNTITLAANTDTVAVFGEFNAYGRGPGGEDKRQAMALDAADGRLLWKKPFGNFVRPVIVSGMLMARPNAFHLRTGEPVMVADGTKPWNLERRGYCGYMAASEKQLYYRMGGIRMRRVSDGGPVLDFEGMRPGCLINLVPAGGVAVMPESSSGCSCSYAALQSTIVFVPPNAK